MGFDYYGLGVIQPCRVENGEVIRTLPTGKEQRIKTTLQTVIPQQTNLFKSPTALFYLKYEGNYYIGYKDGYINTYRESDNLLIGVNTWECSLIPMVNPCGYKMFAGNYCTIFQDRFDLQSLYATYFYRYSGVLPHPIEAPWNLQQAEFGWCDTASVDVDYIFNKEGEYVAIDKWDVQDLVRCPDTEVFL